MSRRAAVRAAGAGRAAGAAGRAGVAPAGAGQAGAGVIAGAVLTAICTAAGVKSPPRPRRASGEAPKALIEQSRPDLATRSAVHEDVFVPHSGQSDRSA